MLATSDLLPIVGLSVFSIISVFFFTMDTNEDNSGTTEKKKSSDHHHHRLGHQYRHHGLDHVEEEHRERERLEREQERREEERRRREERERRHRLERERLERERRERERLRQRYSRTSSRIPTEINYAILILMQGSDFIFFKSSSSSSVYSGIKVKVEYRDTKQEMARKLMQKFDNKTLSNIKIESPEVITKNTCTVGEYLGFFISVPDDSFDFTRLNSTRILSLDSLFMLLNIRYEESITFEDATLDKYTVQLIDKMGYSNLLRISENPLTVRYGSDRKVIISNSSPSRLRSVRFSSN